METDTNKWQLTYDGIACELYEDKPYYRFNSSGQIYSGDYKTDSDDDFYNPMNCTSLKQAEKIQAINKILNLAKKLNDGWKPDYNNLTEQRWTFRILVDGNGKERVAIGFFTGPENCNNTFVYFRSEKIIKRALIVLGEDVIRKAFANDY